MPTFILRLAEGHAGPTVAVKDLIDLRGTPTTAGCAAVARRAIPAAEDAACLAGVRAALSEGRARLVGKTNLHELAAGTTGVNRWFGTPVNPLDPRTVPGGSSSGSAVAVASGDADIALGTDTGGSVRIPSACCGTVGLKTTWGRVPLDGVWPLSPSLDTVGPMARDVTGVVAGMGLLEPGFQPSLEVPGSVGRFRPAADPTVDAAVDAALRAAGLEVSEVSLPGWAAAGDATLAVIAAEAWRVDRHLVEGIATPEAAVAAGVSGDSWRLLQVGSSQTPGSYAAARAVLAAWQAELAAALARHRVLALPTLLGPPPLLGDGDPQGRLLLATAPFNGAGVPALCLPIRAAGRTASLQLVAGAGGEELLVALGAVVEEANR